MIKCISFTGQHIKRADYVTDSIMQNGIYLLTDIAIHEYKTDSNNSICKDMKSITNLCLVYAQMRYQNIFSETCLNHS